LKVQDEKITSLEKLNDWYIEQLLLRQKQKIVISAEKSDGNIVIPAHNRKKCKTGFKIRIYS
jgi:hypothetical protein